jgi:transposase
MDADGEPQDWREWREWRRMQALHLKQAGWTQRAIATALGVTEGAVSQWLTAAKQGGATALRAHPQPGAPPRLTAAQRQQIPGLLGHGAEAYGFRGDLWTCARVAQVIAAEFGVVYSKSQVARLLRALEWSPQMPLRRARQRDEAAIVRWRAEVWPTLYATAQREGRTLVFVDESGFYLLPGVVRTYSPSGQTPLLAERQTRDHLSVMGGCSPAGQLYVLMREESLNGQHTVEFLQHLMRSAGRRLLVIWDGSPIHRRAAVTDLLGSAAGAGIRVEALPSYAPDLNPWDAGGWHHLKSVELHNVSCGDLAQLHGELQLAIGRLRAKPAVIHGFFQAAGLAL